MIAARLKEGLSLKMKQAFINPYVYSRYIPNLKEYSLGELAASHYTQYALCLDNIKMDTLKAEQYVATADLVVADSTSKDSLCYQVNISASGATLQQCMDKLLEQAHAKILIFASKNPESRKIWSFPCRTYNLKLTAYRLTAYCTCKLTHTLLHIHIFIFVLVIKIIYTTHTGQVDSNERTGQTPVHECVDITDIQA